MCGIIGISGYSDVIQDLYSGLISLQHRGQDAAGIITYNGKINIRRGNGLVRDVFHSRHILRLKGNIGVGHVRYPTAGCAKNSYEAQPFYVNSPFGVALAHNGNLVNHEKLSKLIIRKYRRRLNTNSDSEVLLNILCECLYREKPLDLAPKNVFRSIERLHRLVRGSYSAIALIAGQGMVAFRDPHGIRPLIIGERKIGMKKEYIISSENVALNTLGFNIVRDIRPGETIFIDTKNKIHAYEHKSGQLNPCIFEYVYLARPDSLLDNISVYRTRMRFGEHLADQVKHAKLKIDAVIPIPESARPAAFALATKLKLKYREGFVKNRYIGRTFIMPGQAVRKKSIRHKLSPLKIEFRNKNVLLVDDSIVRGNTSRKIVQLARETGAKKVYFAITSPPLKFPCFYGVDMPTKKEFIAYKNDIEGIRKTIGADGLFYQTLSDLVFSARQGNKRIKKFCTACFDGKYITKDITPALIRKAERLRSKDITEKQLTLI